MPQKMEDLFEQIYLHDIRLFTCPVPGAKAATVELEGIYGIFLDPDQIRDSAEELCVVAHELGHCMTGSTHCLSSSLDLIERHEYRADKYAVHRILPAKQIQRALHAGYTEIWQLAEYFNVTEPFLKRALDIYCREGYSFGSI